VLAMIYTLSLQGITLFKRRAESCIGQAP
jgi:hypothetical protein